MSDGKKKHWFIYSWSSNSQTQAKCYGWCLSHKQMQVICLALWAHTLLRYPTHTQCTLCVSSRLWSIISTLTRGSICAKNMLMQIFISLSIALALQISSVVCLCSQLLANRNNGHHSTLNSKDVRQMQLLMSCNPNVQKKAWIQPRKQQMISKETNVQAKDSIQQWVKMQKWKIIKSNLYS